MPSRRAFLSAVGTLGTVALAGCASKEVRKEVERGDKNPPVEASVFVNSIERSGGEVIVQINPDLRIESGEGERATADTVLFQRENGNNRQHAHPTRGTRELSFSIRDTGLYELIVRGDTHNDGGTLVGVLLLDVNEKDLTPISFEKTVYYG